MKARTLRTSLFALLGLLAFGRAIHLLNTPRDTACLKGGALLLLIATVGVWFLVREARSRRHPVTGIGIPLNLVLVAAAAWLATGCSPVPPGYVGLTVNNAGDNRGVSNYTIQTGWVWHMPLATSVVRYPTFIQTAVWTKSATEGNPADESITFTTKDSMAVNADVSISYQLAEQSVPAFYTTFRNDNINAFTHGFLHNVARDAFNNQGGLYTVEQIMGDNGPFLAKVRDEVQELVKPYGVSVKQLGFVGAPRPPQGVIDAINLKVQAQQNALKVQNEITTAEAEANKKRAVAKGEADARVLAAEGEAKANRAVQASITPELLRWTELQNQKAAVDKWDGKQPQVVGQAGLILDLPTPSK